MCDTNNLLREYLLHPDISDNDWNWNNFLLNEENWALFQHHSFVESSLAEHFTTLPDEERSHFLKYGIDCFLTFIQCNFTGPSLNEDVNKFLKRESFTTPQITKLLSINNEDINVNTNNPVLLVVAKIIFKNCTVSTLVNNYWYWRSIMIHQQILDEPSPTLLSEVDKIYTELIPPSMLEGPLKALIDIEICQLYLLFRNISKSRKHLDETFHILALSYALVGKLGKRTRFQEKEVAQLTVEVKKDETVDRNKPIDDSNIPQDIALNDDTRLNSVEFVNANESPTNLTNTEQKALVSAIQQTLVSRPTDELEREEILPIVEMILNQRNSFAVRTVTALIRCKLENKKRRTLERSLNQCEEILESFKREKPDAILRVLDVFGTGAPPIWQITNQYAEILLNIGLVKESLNHYLDIKAWEEVILCYTILELRHKAAEIIQEQLNMNPTVKLWCLLGDATDDVNCYETAWELSKHRSHRAQRHLGNFLYDRKEYFSCIPHYEKSLSINPLQANVWFRCGFASLRSEQWQKAATAYRRYTCLEPDSFEAWNNLAHAYIKLGNKRNAHQALLEAIRCNYENWKVWENFLAVSCDIKNHSDTLRAYHRILDLKGKYLDVAVLNLLMHNILCGDEKSKEHFLKPARELFGRITSIYPNDPNLWQLYSTLAPNGLVQIQRLQKAFRGFCNQNNWDQDLEESKRVLNVGQMLGELLVCSVYAKEIKVKDPIVNSVKLSLRSALTLAQKNDFPGTLKLRVEIAKVLGDIVGFIEES